MKKNITTFILLLYLCPNVLFAQEQRGSSISKDEDAFRFFVIGDWGRNGEFNQQEVANQMGVTGNVFEPEFVISTGDNFYCCGVASVNDPQWMASYENIYKAHSLNIPWYVVLGNHDYKGNPQAEIDYTKVSQRWKMPARYYTFVQEGIRFVFLDTSPFVKKYQKEAQNYADLGLQDTNRQLQWLDSVLVNSKEEWKIVSGHHPIYSTGNKHGNTKELIELVKPILEKNNVQVYFAGHEHDLQYQKPTNSSVHYLVSGSGSEVRPNTPDPQMTRFAQAISGFMAASIHGDIMKVHIIDYQGNTLYQTEISKK